MTMTPDEISIELNAFFHKHNINVPDYVKLDPNSLFPKIKEKNNE